MLFQTVGWPHWTMDCCFTLLLTGLAWPGQSESEAKDCVELLACVELLVSMKQLACV